MNAHFIVRIIIQSDPTIAFQGIIGCVGEPLRVQVSHQAKTRMWAADVRFQRNSSDVFRHFPQFSCQILEFMELMFFNSRFSCSFIPLHILFSFDCSSQDVQLLLTILVFPSPRHPKIPERNIVHGNCAEACRTTAFLKR